MAPKINPHRNPDVEPDPNPNPATQFSYDDELQSVLAAYPDQFRLDYALSRESTNAKGGKMYIQVREAKE